MPTSFDKENIRYLLEYRRRQAVRLLYERHSHQLIRIAYKHTRNWEDSHDVLQDVFFDVFKRHKAISRMSDEPILNYLIKAVRYQAISHYRKKVTTSKRETKYYHEHLTTNYDYAPDGDLIANERAASLGLMVAKLPRREKESLLLQLEGARVKDIARRLSISVGAVERNLTRARKRLRALFKVGR